PGLDVPKPEVVPKRSPLLSSTRLDSGDAPPLPPVKEARVVRLVPCTSKTVPALSAPPDSVVPKRSPLLSLSKPANGPDPYVRRVRSPRAGPPRGSSHSASNRVRRRRRIGRRFSSPHSRPNNVRSQGWRFTSLSWEEKNQFYESNPAPAGCQTGSVGHVMPLL